MTTFLPVPRHFHIDTLAILICIHACNPKQAYVCTIPKNTIGIGYDLITPPHHPVLATIWTLIHCPAAVVIPRSHRTRLPITHDNVILPHKSRHIPPALIYELTPPDQPRRQIVLDQLLVKGL